ncbi:DUF3310 domain-containing protein [Oceanobacillus sojae]|uniref:DUF3310 domain-containing protein n=1 Tax=Oceanobacillus sojae TaxID=582851 RepID=UPI0020C9DDCC|nr:DUF3310 domain-containing protein [Oceanobacillus sojae]
MMKIRITTGQGWYEGLEGAVFEVHKIDSSSGELKYIVERKRPGQGPRFVHGDNCEVIADEIPSSDAVSHPSHYTAGEIEVIDIIKQTVAGYDDPFVAHSVGTATKYLNRAPYKHATPTEDLKKSRAYIDFAIKHLEDGSEEEDE